MKEQVGECPWCGAPIYGPEDIKTRLKSGGAVKASEIDYTCGCRFSATPNTWGQSNRHCPNCCPNQHTQPISYTSFG